MEEVRETLTTHGAKITNEDIWWVKKLAYRINKSAEGFYALFDLEMDGKAIKKLSKDLNLQKSIWRYIFVKKES
jgi:small subunit ribosomal protein S6